MSDRGYNYYTSSPDVDGTKCYAHATCNNNLMQGECLMCLSYVNNFILHGCFLSIGVQFELADCRVRYEQYPFTE
ncbi:hypothetical protein ACJRO7_027167 [Eucalyptus globulus]|uniref:Gnk2-homologous domain-containing protein n=1 Tax=Eucalyptus globulus TaxID=34317 RepID=A0ABD3K0J5_EUCGL